MNNFDVVTKITNKLKFTETFEPSPLLGKLVSHRGFHCVKDSLDRPLENTLSAFEQAWVSGVTNCECDLALTRDGKIILCHDKTLARLSGASKPKSSNSHHPHATPTSTSEQPISSLYWEDVQKIALKSGCRAPLLKEVLEAAVRIQATMSTKCKLVIEIKPDDRAKLIASVLCHFFLENAHFLPHVALVMSFDYCLIQEFGTLFRSTFPYLAEKPDERPLIMLLTNNPRNGKYADRGEFSFEYPKRALEDMIPQAKQLLKPDIGDGIKNSIDGLYMEYDDTMKDKDSAAFRLVETMATEENYPIGVWTRSGDPDDVDSFKWLSSTGAIFVNSDLPDSF